MKRFLKPLLASILIVFLVFTFASCSALSKILSRGRSESGSASETAARPLPESETVTVTIPAESESETVTVTIPAESESEAPEETVPEESASEEPVSEEPASEEPASEEPPADSGSTASPDDESMNAAISMISLALSNGFKDKYTVVPSDDGSYIIVSVWTDGIAQGAMAAASGDESALSAWNTLRDSMITLQKSLDSLVKSMNLDAPVMLHILNDQNKSNSLLSVFHGEIIYDAVS